MQGGETASSIILTAEVGPCRKPMGKAPLPRYTSRIMQIIDQRVLALHRTQQVDVFIVDAAHHGLTSV